MSRWRLFLHNVMGIHKWTKWSDPQPGVDLNRGQDVSVQERRCEICNARELRRAA